MIPMQTYRKTHCKQALSYYSRNTILINLSTAAAELASIHFCLRTAEMQKQWKQETFDHMGGQ